MTRKRYLAVAGMLAVLVAAGFGIAMMLPVAPGVTKANVDRIEKRMIEKAVELAFGKAEMDLSSLALVNSEPCRRTWICADEAQAIITFIEGTIVEKTWIASTEPVLKKIHRWLCL